MAEIYPFRGVRYNQSMVKDLSAVICPPYDIITPQLEQELYRQNQYNFIRIEHNQRLPQDSTLDNKYTRSAAILEEWLKQGVLITDEVPAIYVHDHHFIYQGKEYRRRGLITRVRLEEWHKNIIRPHEGTLAEPKSDRISLLWALRANTSPVLALFEDQKQSLSSLLTAQELGKPVISINSSSEERHNVWAITEPRVISGIYALFAEKPLYIADGHHRYESALIYQREQHTLSSTASGDEAFNFVMMTLVDFADPGLVILPPYRLLRGLSPPKIANLMTKLQSLFDVEELPIDMPGVWQLVDDLLLKANQTRLVLCGLVAEKLLVLTLRDSNTAKKMMPYFHSELYKELDVSIVDHVILEELLGLSGSEDEAKISYNYDIKDTVNRVLAQEYQLAFILRPIKAEVIKAVADAGDRMPRKSTYFYPKLPSGLILNRLV
jgi:uncharacterized protein (DUF1015 family)